MRTAVFTIASRNYFAFVRTLMDSLEETNPQWDRFVGVADELSEEFEAMPHNFRLLSLQEIGLPELKKMIFRYTILEFNTAIKPFIFKLLFDQMGYDRVIYLDPDICVYEKLQEIEDGFAEGKNMILTPHLTGLWNDDRLPDETSILQSGTYNLGFLALAKCSDSMNLLNWWGSKLEYDCVVALERGIFVDQKWMDLVPGIFPNVMILRHEGYNVAYWNLSHRRGEKRGDKYYFNGQLLKFFHFSGLNPNKIDNVSKHQNRFQIEDIGIVRGLFETYADTVLKNDYNTYQKFPYAYNFFENGEKISDLFRYAYRDNEWLQKKCGADPFGAAAVFNEEKRRIIPYMMQFVWKNRPDVQTVYPDMSSQDYINWFQLSSGREYGLNREFLGDSTVKAEEIKKESQKQQYLQQRQQLSTFKKFIFFLKRHLPNRLYLFIRQVYRKLTGKSGEAVAPIIAPPKNEDLMPVSSVQDNSSDGWNKKPGVELVGYIRSEHGVGESARHMASALEKTGISWSAYDFEVGNIARQEDRSWDYKITDKWEYPVLIFNINADQMPVVRKHIPDKVWEGSYKIAIWYWELPDFPDEWVEAFELVDEVWAPTRFIQDALDLKATCPVLHMPLPMQLEEPEGISRKDFGLPKDAFLFLNMYDTLSIQSRKNPEAAISAFKKSFAKDDMSVGLVVKVNNSHMSEDELDQLAQIKGDYQNIYFITEILSRKMVNGLVNCCDVAVSLHRSEGLGLLCQEAMYFGKPVIATAWSGNVDFMTSENSCLVDFRLRPIGKDYGPYKAEQLWADADIDQASEYMVRLRGDEEYYKKVSQKAQRKMKYDYSPEQCSDRMKKRLERINRYLI